MEKEKRKRASLCRLELGAKLPLDAGLCRTFSTPLTCGKIPRSEERYTAGIA